MVMKSLQKAISLTFLFGCLHCAPEESVTPLTPQEIAVLVEYDRLKKAMDDSVNRAKRAQVDYDAKSRVLNGLLNDDPNSPAFAREVQAADKELRARRDNVRIAEKAVADFALANAVQLHAAQARVNKTPSKALPANNQATKADNIVTEKGNAQQELLGFNLSNGPMSRLYGRILINQAIYERMLLLFSIVPPRTETQQQEFIKYFSIEAKTALQQKLYFESKEAMEKIAAIEKYRSGNYAYWMEVSKRETAAIISDYDLKERCFFVAVKNIPGAVQKRVPVDEKSALEIEKARDAGQLSVVVNLQFGSSDPDAKASICSVLGVSIANRQKSVFYTDVGTVIQNDDKPGQQQESSKVGSATAKSLLEMANQQVKNGSIEGAAKYAKKILEEFPNSPQAKDAKVIFEMWEKK
jgi:hypothetical protein